MLLAVQPTFSRYSHSTGEIEDYTEEDFRQCRLNHVFAYFKSVYIKPPTATARPFADVT